MDNVGALIFFAVIGAAICAKARVPSGAVVFALIGLALFVSTPAGGAIPGAVADFMEAIDDSTTPALTDAEPETAGVLQ